MDELFNRIMEQMPNGNDLTLIVLKGHLLIEEQLGQIISEFLPNAEIISQAKLTFFNKIIFSQAICWKHPNDKMWELIKVINSLRNDLAHNLESSKRQAKFDTVIDRHLKMSIDDSDFKQIQLLSRDEQFKMAFAYALGFLHHFKIDIKNNSYFFHTALQRKDKLREMTP